MILVTELSLRRFSVFPQYHNKKISSCIAFETKPASHYNDFFAAVKEIIIPL